MIAPLQDIRILDLTRLLPGAVCSLMLADQGAQVIKIEQPGSGDYMRWFLPRAGEYAAIFHAVNRNKLSVTLNLKSGAAVLKRLVEQADVLLEGNRPGVMERLGLGYDTLSAVNPRLIMCSLSGFGQAGPLSQAPAHDLNYAALSGILAAGDAAPLPVQVMDYGGAYLAAFAIVTALFQRERTGSGAYIDAALLDAGLSLMALARAQSFAMKAPPASSGELLTGGYACYRRYRTRDGRDVTLAALEEKFWRGFCQKAGRDDLASAAYLDPDEQPGLMAELEGVFAAKTEREWIELLAHEQTCFAPVLDVMQAAAHPQILARDALYEAEGVAHTLTPFRLGERLPHRPAPDLGADTHRILEGAGYTAEEIAQLRQEGVI